MANYNIVEKVEMCSDDCCGKPITECVCGPDCEHCDCHAKNNIGESYSDDFQYSDDDDGNRTVSNCCGADAYIRHNEISVGDTGRCSDCREMAEFIPEKDFFESTVSEEDVTVDNAGNIAGYLDTIDDYVEQVFMIDDQTRAEDIKEMAHRIQNAVDDIRIRELKIQPSNLRQNFESSNLGEDEVTRIKELAGIFKSSVEEVINEEPESMSVDFNDFMQWFFTEDEDYLSFASEAIQSIKANGFVKYEKIDMFNRAEYVPGRFVTGGDEDGEYHPSELTLRESKELDEIAPLVPLAVGAAAAATGAIAYKAGNLIHKGVSKIKKNLSDYGKGTSNPANEETVNEEHDIDILKAVAQQMEADAHTGDFTAIEELLQDIPQENLEAFLTDHRSKNEYPEENIQPAVETVEQNEDKGNE